MNNHPHWCKHYSHPPRLLSLLLHLPPPTPNVERQGCSTVRARPRSPNNPSSWRIGALSAPHSGHFFHHANAPLAQLLPASVCRRALGTASSCAGCTRATSTSSREGGSAASYHPNRGCQATRLSLLATSNSARVSHFPTPTEKPYLRQKRGNRKLMTIPILNFTQPQRSVRQ